MALPSPALSSPQHELRTKFVWAGPLGSNQQVLHNLCCVYVREIIYIDLTSKKKSLNVKIDQERLPLGENGF